MHLVIFSDNPDHNYAKWLIKEAFWTLPRLCEKINTKISLISPHASEIADSILLDCPGLADFSYHVNRNKSYADTDNESKNIQIDDIPFPEIWYQDTSFSSRSILNTLKDISSSNDYLYFVVDSVSDVGSIKLATRIRSLRSANRFWTDVSTVIQRKILSLRFTVPIRIMQVCPKI